jgi:hypothetical protein
MLEVVGFRVCESSAVEFSDYLPFKFYCRPEADSPSLYWRTGDLKSTLLEVAIDRIDGRFLGMSLLLPGQVNKDFPVLNLSTATAFSGYPLINTDGWSEDRFRDESSQFQVFIDASRLLILLSSSVATAKISTSQNITFGMDGNDSIRWILIEKLETENLLALENL